jgi:hypothetical protein
VREFHAEIVLAPRDFPASRIINADESVWRAFWQGRRTLAEAGAEPLRVEVNGDSKAEMILVGFVTFIHHKGANKKVQPIVWKQLSQLT